MKTIIFFVILFSPTYVISQTQDTLHHRFGFILDYDGSVVDYFGIKYHIEKDLSLFTRLFFSYSKQNPQDLRYDNDGIDRDFSGRIGVEYVLLRVDNASLFLQGGVGYSWSKSDATGRLGQDIFVGTQGYTGKAYELIIGVGTEYFITKQFSLFGYQTIEGRFSTTRYVMPSIADRTNKNESFDFGVAKAGLSFYF